MNSKKLNNRIFFGVFFMLIFIYFMIFFTEIHPIVLSDTDDWFFAFKHRGAIPLWEEWNPTRVFAETLMPVVSEVCAYIIYPVKEDFFKSLTFGYAFVLVTAITVLIGVICNYLYKKYGLKQYILIIMLFFFILCHFWIFRISRSGNNYMFKTIDACTYFYYVIPNIINCIMVIFMINNNYMQDCKKTEEGEKIYERKALFVLLMYFCIFSNIWASIIIAAFIGSRVLLDLAYMIKKHQFNIVGYIRKQSLNLIILMVWFVSQIFEINGGRAAAISSDFSVEEIFNTLNTEWNVLKGLNNNFVICILMILVSGLYFVIKDREWNKLIEIGQFALAFIIMEVYLVLSCAKVGAWYISRSDVFYGLFFFIMLIVILCFITTINHLPMLKAFMPIMLVIIFFDCNSSGKTFLESNVEQLSPNIVSSINNDILQQVTDAQENGLETIDLYVPSFNSSDNWPYATYANDRIADCLYKLGILDYNLQIQSIIPSEEKNKQLHIR